LRKLYQAVEQSPASVMITDASGYIEYVNPKFTEITGYTIDEVIGKKPNILKSGETSSEEYEKLWKTISSGKEWRGEFHNKKKNGELYWETAVIAPIKDNHGNITHYIAVNEDITERKELEEQLNQIRKMESIGTLTGGIAHDFNNILTAINGYAQLLLMKLEPEDTYYQYVLKIFQSGQRAADLIRQLLAFSRRQIIQPRVININKIIVSLENMLNRMIDEDIKVIRIIDKNLKPVKADPSQIEQVIINLIVNARDAVNQKTDHASEKKIILETRNISIDDDFVKRHPGSRSGDHVMISVSDNGAGMNDETKKRIFDPFFTTKEQGKGTGLGLSTVYGIVKQNRGSIYVFSEPGKGTTFKIYWPATNNVFLHETDRNAIKELRRGNENILFVEDEKAVRDFTGRALHLLGYTVITASNGIEALELIKSRGLKVDLLITDVVMPQMGGVELARKVRATLPDISVLFTSGYPNNRITQNGKLETRINFLQKPYSIQGLTKKIREIFDSE